ncbi:hypothetical protein RHMOL_Rhmol08G0262100 [Rhododendron molle]|uniref:Uncharacterized protein n=1 Tax=Rhododendron molle TaxID=49168 RepID=A0ACC0MUQ8_RHOML|nr:hypothetical protein RHMOL_Rhmol08G0262100 [Rhododendron molle]
MFDDFNGTVDHLVNNAGIVSLCLFEDATNVGDFAPIMVIVLSTELGGKLMYQVKTLRTEVGSDTGITIVVPGAVDSEITRGDFKSKAGMDGLPVELTEGCTKAVFKSICRGDRYLIEPAWLRIIYPWKLLCPEAVDSFNRWLLITRPNNSTSNHNSGVLKSD